MRLSRLKPPRLDVLFVVLLSCAMVAYGNKWLMFAAGVATPLLTALRWDRHLRAMSQPAPSRSAQLELLGAFIGTLLLATPFLRAPGLGASAAAVASMLVGACLISAVARKHWKVLPPN